MRHSFHCTRLLHIRFFKEEKCNTPESVIILTKYLLKSKVFFHACICKHNIYHLMCMNGKVYLISVID